MKQLWKEIRKSKLAVTGLLVVSILILTAALGPFFLHYDPYAIDLDLVIRHPYGPKSPSVDHPLGTDDLGRDLLSRIVYGSRVSLQVGILAMLIATCIGVTLGMLAGYFGGWLDLIITWLTDTAFAFPAALLAIAVMAIVPNPDIFWIFLVLGLIGWAGIARVVRGKVLSVKEEEYTQSARALGAGHIRIMIYHILPNCMAPIMVSATINIAGNILTEAWLSFLGLGAQPPTPSWGLMVTEGQAYLATHYWMCLFPGLAIAITVLGWNLLGDGLRDALDPRLKDV
ncbi:ABC transporter permease [bacterium]|nr:ABC transporter permease [candidate division CSSED10-310 bacterium]